MTKLRTVSAVMLATAMWLGALAGVSPGQEKLDPKLTPAGLQSPIQSLSGQLDSIKTELGSELIGSSL